MRHGCKHGIRRGGDRSAPLVSVLPPLNARSRLRASGHPKPERSSSTTPLPSTEEWKKAKTGSGLLIFQGERRHSLPRFLKRDRPPPDANRPFSICIAPRIHFLEKTARVERLPFEKGLCFVVLRSQPPPFSSCSL